jgi:Raf kinase inhibitor-like YbhB/YbcL family protein
VRLRLEGRFLAVTAATARTARHRCPGRSGRAGGRFVHWLGWGIPPDTGGLAEGEAAPLEGSNDFGSVGYRGPCPPRGRHRYRFRLHALGEELRLAPGAGVGELERTLTHNLLAVAELVGTYER